MRLGRVGQPGVWNCDRDYLPSPPSPLRAWLHGLTHPHFWPAQAPQGREPYRQKSPAFYPAVVLKGNPDRSQCARLPVSLYRRASAAGIEDPALYHQRSAQRRPAHRVYHAPQYDSRNIPQGDLAPLRSRYTAHLRTPRLR
ncbi:hypothetical protein D3C78_1285680 [compost metagenome]